MKGTEQFKEIIQSHLKKQASEDALFAPVYANKNKNIDDCITYILNQVQKSGCNGFADEEIFGMAMHYYQEDNVNPGNPISAKVVVNHSEAKQEVTKEEVPIVEMAPAHNPKPRKTNKTKEIPSDQLTLF